MSASLTDGTTAPLPTVNMVTPQPNVLDIEREVLKVTSGISEKFVAEPNRASALCDLIIGLERYKNAIRWKEFFSTQNKLGFCVFMWGYPTATSHFVRIIKMGVRPALIPLHESFS